MNNTDRHTLSSSKPWQRIACYAGLYVLVDYVPKKSLVVYYQEIFPLTLENSLNIMNGLDIKVLKMGASFSIAEPESECRAVSNVDGELAVLMLSIGRNFIDSLVGTINCKGDVVIEHAAGKIDERFSLLLIPSNYDNDKPSNVAFPRSIMNCIGRSATLVKSDIAQADNNKVKSFFQGLFQLVLIGLCSGAAYLLSREMNVPTANAAAFTVLICFMAYGFKDKLKISSLLSLVGSQKNASELSSSQAPERLVLLLEGAPGRGGVMWRFLEHIPTLEHRLGIINVVNAINEGSSPRHSDLVLYYEGVTLVYEQYKQHALEVNTRQEPSCHGV